MSDISGKMVIANFVMSYLDRGISLIDMDSDTAKIIIDNTNRTEEDVEQLAKEFKVQLLLVAGAVIHAMPEFKVLYKSVSKDEYDKELSSLVSKYKDLIP